MAEESGAPRSRGRREPLREDEVLRSRCLAAEQAPLPMITVAAARGRYLFANQAYARLIGRSLDEIMAADAYELWLLVTHPDDVAHEREALERLAAGHGDQFELEKRIVSADGQARWVQVNCFAARDEAGRLDTITIYFTDLEKPRADARTRADLESQLRQAERLSSLGKLAGGVAHDFNNRLLIIMGHTERLRMALPVESPLLQHTEMVLGSAQRAAELTRQLLAYSRRQVLKPESFDLSQTVDRMRRMLERLIGEHIELLTVLGAKHPIFSDPGQIEQVILNLVLNARDAMPDGGRLTLETADVDEVSFVHAGLESGAVTLTVKDTGSGIANEHLPRIFEPFFTTKAVGHGTGLGLSSVEGIVSQSGGTTRVTSEVGRGSEFVVYLPRGRAEVSVEPLAPKLAVPDGVSFETVLVCDDDEGVRNLLADLLCLRAYTVLRARSGPDAIAVAEAHAGPIHLLVSDIVMPEIGGIELARELRKQHQDLCVLFVSGYTDDVTHFAESLDARTHFLPKPFLPGELTQVVCAILESGRPARPPASSPLLTSAGE